MPNRPRKPTRPALAWGALALFAALAPVAALAQLPPGLAVDIERPLRFGQFIILGHGSRAVGFDGAVADAGVIATRRDGVQPARFTVSFQRGANPARTGPVVVQVVVNAAAQGASTAVRGRITAFAVGRQGQVRPGEPFEITLDDCTAARCSRTVELGARLEVDGEGDGSQLAFPLSITARTLLEP